MNFIEKVNDVSLDMVFIPGGSFLIKAPGKELVQSSKSLQHQVSTLPFFMSKYPITQAQWREIANLPEVDMELRPDPSYFKDNYKKIDRWTRPVESICWDSAVEFCQRLSDKTGKQYRLPTEAEWEYACRGGTSTPYHLGEPIGFDFANYEGKFTYEEGVEGIYREQTTPVGYFDIVNNFGLSDLYGNVWEWCQDNYHGNYKKVPTDGSAWLSGCSDNKVVRGCSWNEISINFSVDEWTEFRNGEDRDIRSDFIGFRVVCTVPKN
jgi:formylglycine-generating enzyme required for sulfatase activity